MGMDLVSACIFCAGFLLGGEPAPRPGLSTEIGLSYATLSRQIPDSAPGRDDGDVSDATPKFLLIGLGNARDAADGLGAGTPAFEWRVRVAFGPSHDEQQRFASPEQVQIETDGTGRYENFALLGRLPVGAADSIELGIDRRSHKATDVLNIGQSEHQVSEQRVLNAERADGAIGWRHRFPGFELAAAARYVKVTGYNATAGAFMNGSGGFFGGSLEARYRREGWTLALSGEAMSGSIDLHEESFPDFHARDTKPDAALSAGRLLVGYSWPTWDVFLAGTYSREHLPFVALAVTGTETVDFDGGFHPDSTSKEFFGDLTVRHVFTPAIRGRLGLRLASGQENVDLTDAVGNRPPEIVEVNRRGRWGGGASRTLGFPELTFFLGADFAIGAPR